MTPADPRARLQPEGGHAPPLSKITGFIHADNYFELYVNGQFVARDSIPMTPFNTSVVRFRARYPMTHAFMGVDWETHPGIGMEYANHNVGDAGFIGKRRC